MNAAATETDTIKTRTALRPVQAPVRDLTLVSLPDTVEVDDATGRAIAAHVDYEDEEFESVDELIRAHWMSLAEALGDDEVAVLRIQPSDEVGTDGAVDARVIVRVLDQVVGAWVTLCPREADGVLDTWGSLDQWADEALVDAIEAAEDARTLEQVAVVLRELGYEGDDDDHVEVVLAARLARLLIGGGQTSEAKAAAEELAADIEAAGPPIDRVDIIADVVAAVRQAAAEASL